MLCHLMQSNLLSIGSELEKDRYKDPKMRKLNETKKKVREADLVGENSSFIFTCNA